MDALEERNSLLLLTAQYQTMIPFLMLNVAAQVAPVQLNWTSKLSTLSIRIPQFTPCLTQQMTSSAISLETLLGIQIPLARKNFDGLERTPPARVTDAKEKSCRVRFLLDLRLPLEQTSVRTYQSLLLFQAAASVTLQLNICAKSGS